MFKNFYKTLRWFIMAALIVGGFYCLYLANEYNSLKPTMPMVFSFGLAYVLSIVWYKYERSVQFVSLVVFIGNAALALFDYEIIYILTGVSMDLNYHLAWLGLNAVIGVPVMWLTFKTLD